jgi:ATP-dependent DNA helicase DinG
MRLPHHVLPALAIAGGRAVIAVPNGETRTATADAARAALADGEILVCHALFAASRIGARPTRALYDVLELFAFVRPAQPCLPSPLGLARALELPEPHTADECARTLHRATGVLLDGLLAYEPHIKERARRGAAALTRAGWRWGPAILSVLGEPEKMTSPLAGFDAWRGLPEWEDSALPGKPGSQPVATEEAQHRLAEVTRGRARRKSQDDFVAAATTAFAPRERAGSPRIALVEAGTGTGKTLGYLAPATLWAEKNGPGLWISTYTKNLQRQIVQEIARIYPDPREREEKAVLRKGRENYLCLLNFEDAVKRTVHTTSQAAVTLGLIARWIRSTRDGDLTGAGFPAFVASSIPLGELTDRRGECIYAACPHYRSCFIERAVRRAKNAPIVVANHALVMAQAISDGIRAEEADDVRPERHLRYVFDEGHHLFDAADSGFAAHLSGREMADLRRWLRGPEGRASRARGLQERVRELIEGDDEAISALDDALNAANALAAGGWAERIKAGGARGPAEVFLAEVHAHVRARSDDRDEAYGIEADTRPIGDTLRDAARELDRALSRLIGPLLRLVAALRKRLDDEAANLEPGTRIRIDAAARGIERRARMMLPAWRGMLAALEEEPTDDNQFADWFEIARDANASDGGRDRDVGLRRHWIDPTIPFAETILKPAHGALITSATLRDQGGGDDTGNFDLDWRAAEVRVGAHHLPEPPVRALFGSPFDWREQSRIIVVRDIDRRDVTQLATAYRELFLAAGGGALGLFTSVRNLRATQSRLVRPLADTGIALYSQHVDALDTGTLVDLFRAEENACLLGTDALRDGVDVPGRSLRLCVFDKVPWPKPTILHKARRARFGKTYDDLLARLRLKQAFGRLIRSETDKGVFVILDAACPSRLLAALPPEAPVLRVGLAEAIAEVRNFLWMDAAASAPDAAASA